MLAKTKATAAQYLLECLLGESTAEEGLLLEELTLVNLDWSWIDFDHLNQTFFSTGYSRLELWQAIVKDCFGWNWMRTEFYALLYLHLGKVNKSRERMGD